MTKMIRMVSVAELPHVYAGKVLEKGAEFDVEPQHVRLMTVLGRAVLKEEPNSQTYATRDMVPPTSRRRKNLH